MPVKILFRGVRYSIALWLDESAACAVEDFILELYADNDPDAEAIIYELEKTSSHGPSPNKHKFRYLKGSGQDLVEFKARGGSRVLGFIDQPRRRIVCTHGVPKLKQKRFEREIEKAQRIRNTYLIETEEGQYVN
jgi:hypothetical protein